MIKTLVKMLPKSVNDFQINWTQQLLYVMMAFGTSVYESTGYTPQFHVFDKEINLPIDIQQPPPEQWNKTDVHQFVQQKHADMQRAHEAPRLHLHAAQLQGNALYISEAHDFQCKPGGNVWLHSPVTPKGLSPKLSSPWKCASTSLQCLDGVTFRIANRVKQKETIVHYDRLQTFIQRPEDVRLPECAPSFFKKSPKKSTQKQNSTIRQHCTCYRT